MIRLGEADLPWLQEFLMQNSAQAMFPLVNLRDCGLDGIAPRAMKAWRQQAPEGVLCLSNDGMLMPILPNAGPSEIATATEVVSGLLRGCMGVTAQVEACLAALGLSRTQRIIGTPEPHLTLDLERLIVPPGEIDLIPLAQADIDLVTRWRAAYVVEIMGETVEHAPTRAAGDIAAYLRRDSHRVLRVDGQPVAMTGFNAIMPEIVQIGGVYTPPEMRGRGYARMALARHLLEARGTGVQHSVLFAANEAATRAYTAIGFQRIGEYSAVFFKEPMDV